VSAGTGETTAAAADPDKVPPPVPKVTDILTVLPSEVAWITPRRALLQDPQFRSWNMGALGAVGLLLFGKLAVVLWRARARAAATPLHALDRELRRSNVPRGQFYQLAARYIQMSHDPSRPLPDPQREVLARSEKINYSPEKEWAADTVPGEERAQVLAALRA
jgi:hypothetical protein